MSTGGCDDEEVAKSAGDEEDQDGRRLPSYGARRDGGFLVSSERTFEPKYCEILIFDSFLRMLCWWIMETTD